MADIHEITAILREQFSGLELTVHSADAGDPSIQVPCETVFNICQFLRDDDRLRFNSLMSMTGIDYPPDFIAVVYHLHSLSLRHKVTIRTMAPRDNGSVPTVSSVWALADWLEREIFDLLGLSFSGHPDLRRLLLPEDWVGHPLRKDYQEQAEYHGIPTVRVKKVGSSR
ncbi:NADH-quinone oxidoreductase subunit C [bacterium]|nr:NADH-quinone oxidoreductase subunit C [bacterium]